MKQRRGKVVRTATRAGSVSWWGRSSCWPAWTTLASWPPPPPCCCLERTRKQTNKQAATRDTANVTRMKRFSLQWIEPDIKIRALRVYRHVHMKRDDADKRLSCGPRSWCVHQIFMCGCEYSPRLCSLCKHSPTSQRRYGFNRGGINSAITVEHLYRVKPLTVGQHISHQSLSRPSKKKKKKSLGLSSA